MYHSGHSKTPWPSYRSTPNNLFDSLEAIPVTEHQQCEIFHDNFLYMVLEIFCKSRIVLCAKENNKVDSIIKVQGRCLSKLLSFLLIGFNDCLGPRPHVSGDFCIRKFFYADTNICVHTSRIRIIYDRPHVSDSYPDISKD